MTDRQIGIVISALERDIARRWREYERTTAKRDAYFAAHPDRVDADAIRLREMEEIAGRLRRVLDGDLVMPLIPEPEASAFLAAIDEDDEAPEVLAIAATVEQAKIAAVSGRA